MAVIVVSTCILRTFTLARKLTGIPRPPPIPRPICCPVIMPPRKFCDPLALWLKAARFRSAVNSGVGGSFFDEGDVTALLSWDDLCLARSAALDASS